MRVLAVGNLYPPAAAGGAERIWTSGVTALRRAGHEVRVLTTAPVAGAEVPAEVLGRERQGDPPVYRELEWWWRDFSWPDLSLPARLALVRRNREVLRRHLAWSPDVVSYWALGGLPLSLLETVRGTTVPAVGVVPDDWMVYGFEVDPWLRTWRRAPRPLAAAAERMLGVPTRAELGPSARWLFISRYVEERARAAGWALPDTGLAHPGVDPGRFPFQAPGPWRWRLGCIGRVEPRKGVATAIEALAALPAEATLTIDGEAEGDHRAELEALALRLGVLDRVRFHATPSATVADAYASADAVLFPVTWDEPWGLVPLEAMSVGRPVVATATGGSAEYLDDGRNCLRFARGDAAGLAECVRRMAADGGLRERLVTEGRATAARFSQDAFERTVVEELEAAAGL